MDGGRLVEACLLGWRARSKRMGVLEVGGQSVSRVRGAHSNQTLCAAPALACTRAKQSLSIVCPLLGCAKRTGGGRVVKGKAAGGRVENKASGRGVEDGDKEGSEEGTTYVQPR